MLSIADDQLAVLAAILEVLRHRADRGVVEDLVVAADGGVAFDHRVRADARAAADAHRGPMTAYGGDLDVVVELGAGLDDGGRMNARRAHSGTLSGFGQRQLHLRGDVAVDARHAVHLPERAGGA